MNNEFVRLSPPQDPQANTVTVPGSKSFTNRALLIAALAEGTSVLYGGSRSDDTNYLIEGLQRFGIKILREGDSYKVFGQGSDLLPFKGSIDLGPAGTSMRFLLSVCAAVPGSEITLRGTERMHQRPIAPLVDALRALGAEIEYLENEGSPPVLVKGQQLNGGTITMDGSVSSQFFSSIMMIAPLLGGGLRLVVEGEQVSQSYIDLTFETMGTFGIDVLNRRYTEYLITPNRRYHAHDYQIESDASGASYFWGIGALSGIPTRVLNVHPESRQGDVHFPILLAEMGCSVTEGRDEHSSWVEVSRAGPLRAISADMSSMPDTAQTLAVVAAFAEGTTYLSGLSTLRHKETDRLKALVDELAKIGIESSHTDDSISIVGGKPRAGTIKTYEDHRMAMAFAMLGSVISDVKIEDPYVVQKSFPSFWQLLEPLGVTLDWGPEVAQ